MIDPQSLSELRDAIRIQVAGNRPLLDQLRKEILPRKAGTASTGKRQADHFVPAKAAIEEYDIWATLDA